MRKLTQLFSRIQCAEEGQSLVEYGLIIALVAIAVITVLALVGTNLTGLFSNIAGQLSK